MLGDGDAGMPSENGYAKLNDKKESKADVNYRKSTDPRQRCGTCSMFRPPASCTLVKGTIYRSGVCDEFEPRGEQEEKEGNPY